MRRPLLLPLLLLLLLARSAAPFGAVSSAYIQHSFSFPAIPYNAGVHHIHSPQHFMEPHGFALPGFRITGTRAPRWMGEYVVAEFDFCTHLGGRMSAKLFSGALDSSHVLVLDCDGAPCLLGWLRVRRLSPTSGVVVQARADLLRPCTVWERLLGGERRVRREGVGNAVRKGYACFKNDANMALYIRLLMSAAGERRL